MNGRVEMHLVATRDTSFTIDGQRFAFAAGESIHTENSHKYGPRGARLLLLAGGWTPLAEWTDAGRRLRADPRRSPAQPLRAVTLCSACMRRLSSADALRFLQYRRHGPPAAGVDHHRPGHPQLAGGVQRHQHLVELRAHPARRARPADRAAVPADPQDHCPISAGSTCRRSSSSSRSRWSASCVEGVALETSATLM